MLSLLKKFWDALRGIKVALLEESSFQLQIIAAVFVLALGLFLTITKTELIILIFTIALVLGLELANSVVERIFDIVKKEHHPKIKDAKDIMAAAVTISAIAAFIIGILIFLPYLSSLI